MDAGENGERFVPSLMKAKSRFYEVCRTDGVPVPCQVVWGSDDPLGSVDQGLWLFRGIAKRQRAAQFHVINRAGALPFREEPESFHQVVSAFADGVFR
jgi:pimeloyl-ACP methyl ester carboxylesterase